MDVQPGAWIGPWHLREQIGQGGFGKVFLAAGQEGNRAAVKVLIDSSGADPSSENYLRFEQELQLLQKLSGRATARVINADIKDSPPWIATQYVPGESLHSEILNDGPLNGDLWWALVADMILGLQEAHHHRIIHRDINPLNVMRSSRGSVIIDFGASLLLGSQEDRITRHSTPLTVQYASPEQLQGHPVSGYTDVFSMGLTLGFAALGHAVFKAETLGEIVNKIVNEEPDFGDLVDAPRREFLSKLLHKDPSERPTIWQAQELSAQLQKKQRRRRVIQETTDKAPNVSARSPAGQRGNVRRFRPSDRERPGDALVSRNRISLRPSIASSRDSGKPSWEDMQIQVLNTLIRAGKSSFELRLGESAAWLLFQGAFDQVGNLPLELEMSPALTDFDIGDTRSRLRELDWEAPDGDSHYWLNMLSAEIATKPAIARLIVTTARAALKREAWRLALT